MNTEEEIKKLSQQFIAISEKLDRLITLGQDVENRVIALENRPSANETSTTDSPQ